MMFNREPDAVLRRLMVLFAVGLMNVGFIALALQVNGAPVVSCYMLFAVSP